MTAQTEEDRWEAYFTPGAVAEQGLRLIPLLRSGPPQSLLDLGTGSGVFGQRARLVWPGIERIGIEVRASERRAARHYEQFLPGDFFDVGQLGGVDLVVSNPPFSRTREAMVLARSLLSPRGIALFFVRSSWGTAAKDYPWLRRHLPTLQADLVGRVNMRRGKSRKGHEMTGDNVGHKWLCMERRGRSVYSWQTILLPPLPGELRRWTIRPGTEPHVLPLARAFWPQLGALQHEEEGSREDLQGMRRDRRSLGATGLHGSRPGMQYRERVSEWVFPSRVEGKHVEFVYLTWRKIVEVSAIDPTGVVIHTARHGLATCALRDGTPLEDVSLLLGHRTTQVTRTVYGRPLATPGTRRLVERQAQIVGAA